MIPIVLHIPHASRQIPDTERGELVLSDTELEQELLLMTDAWTDELCQISDHYDVRLVMSPVSRLICDVERFRDDSEEPMSCRGMGAIYTRTANGEPLRELTAETRERLLKAYYDPHHASLTQAVDEALDSAGACLIIDLHSFPSVPLPYELDQAPERPDVCIGFDEVHGQFLDCDEWRSACQWARFTGAANRPFMGSIVPIKHLKNTNVLSAMIEVRRDLYMDETTGRKTEQFNLISSKVMVLAVAIASAATKHLEACRRLELPYEIRVPLIWSDSDAFWLDSAIAALGKELVEEVYEQADAYVKRVWSGEERPTDPTVVPRSETELMHFREVTNQEFLANTIMGVISEDGSVVEAYNWDGAGQNTSPGSSFYACVMEWNGVYAWFSEVDSGGPFNTLEKASAGMARHCG